MYFHMLIGKNDYILSNILKGHGNYGGNQA